MKKLLILLALCMVVSVLLVACTENEEQPEVTTDATTEATTEEPTTEAPTTEAPTTEEPTTQAPTTEEPTTEEPTTEAPTTEEPTTEEPAPEPVKVIAAMSWDTLTTAHPVNGKTIVSNGGEFMTWNSVANIDTNDTALKLFGWIAYYTEVEGTVGYSLNGGELVYDESFTYTAEIGVQQHIAANCPGALSACRFEFDISLEGLGAGTHTLSVVAKDTEGNVETIRDITLNIAQVDPVEELVAVEFDGTNGTVSIAAGGVYKFSIVNYGGKTMNIANSASCTVTAGTYTLPADTINGNDRVQFIPGPNEGWDNFVLTIVNNGDAAVEIVLTIQ